MVSSHPRFGSLIHNSLIKIFARIVKGPANPNGSYMLFTCESIALLVRLSNRFEMLFSSIGCVVFLFFLGERLILTLNWSWSVLGLHVIPSTFSVGLGSIVSSLAN